MTAVGLLMAGAGVVLILSGVRDADPRQMVIDAITGTQTASPASGATDRTSVPVAPPASPIRR